VSRHSGGPTPLTPAERRTRLRRVGALGGMLALLGGLVVVRSTLAPAPSQALSTPGLAAAVATPGRRSASAGPSSSPSAGPPSSSPSRAARHHHHHRAVQHTPVPTPAHTQAPAPVTRQVTGQAYDVGYGIVQVRVTVRSGRITDVAALSLPSGGRSGDISSYAGPQLRREAISRQSAQIDSVSGASYTSAGYARSLQSALDQVGM
jgi:uncharacterized protein with FMN-binding domain